MFHYIFWHLLLYVCTFGFFSKMSHRNYLIFGMKLAIDKGWKLTESDFCSKCTFSIVAFFCFLPGSTCTFLFYLMILMIICLCLLWFWHNCILYIHYLCCYIYLYTFQYHSCVFQVYYDMLIISFIINHKMKQTLKYVSYVA